MLYFFFVIFIVKPIRVGLKSRHCTRNSEFLNNFFLNFEKISSSRSRCQTKNNEKFVRKEFLKKLNRNFDTMTVFIISR